MARITTFSPTRNSTSAWPRANSSSTRPCTGRKYGTLKSTVVENLVNGVDVLIDIDTRGAASIRACNDPFILEALADVFIMPPSLEELRHRLTRRGTETPEQIDTRIRNAAEEMAHWRC